VASRGTARSSKRAATRPKKPKPEAPVEGDEAEWARGEIEKTSKWIGKADEYLEQELDAACGEAGNAAEAIRIRRVLVERQDRALKVAAEARSSLAVQASPEEDRRRYDLSGGLGAEA